MSLDLDSLLDGWNSDPENTRARLVTGRDGAELLQLRIDMGVLQMMLDGRPDGESCHGMPTAREMVNKEVRLGRSLPPASFDELTRELHQLNFRRLALATIVDERFSKGGDVRQIRPYLVRAIRDVDECLKIIELRQEAFAERSRNEEQDPQAPALVFNRARLRTQLRVVDGEYDEAVEEAMNGGRELASLLQEHGMDAQDCERDPGVCYLRELEKRVREQYRIERTLRERLEEAVESEDFEAAAQIRDEMRQKQTTRPQSLPPPKL